MIKGFLFDYGATLDTAGCHWGQMLWGAWQRCGVMVTEEQFRDAYVYGERTLGSNNIIKPSDTFRVTLDVKLRLEFEYLKSAGVLDGDRNSTVLLRENVLNDVYRRVVDTTKESCFVLERLHQNYEMVLVSNFYGNIRTVLSEFGLDVFFKDIVESAEVNIRKPAPQIYEIGVERLGLRPDEVVVVGDSFSKDVVPARSLGCHTVWLKGKPWKQESVDETVPTRIIYSLKELLSLDFLQQKTMAL
jgi:HAD hydrolase, family IA, variant 1